MLPAAGKGERRNLRGSARLPSKMSGRQPRLRMLRPRPQQQQTKNEYTDSVAEVSSRQQEGNLKEAERLVEVKKRDAKPADAKIPNYTKATSEMDDGDDDDDSDDGKLAIDEDECEPSLAIDEDEREPSLDVNLAAESTVEEVIDLELNVQNSYECKSCKPAKTLPSIKAYLDHLRRDHEHKVSRRNLLI